MKTRFPLAQISVALVVSACAAASSVSGAVLGPPRRPFQDRPDDVSRQHVESVSRSPQTYTIDFRGAVDGVMTRMPVGYGAFVQGW